MHTRAWASALLLVFGKLGNARASMSGTSNRDKTPALFVSICLKLTIHMIRRFGEAVGTEHTQIL